MQCNAADELHVEVAHVERALAGLTHNRKRLRQDGVEGFARRHTALEPSRLLAQRVVRQRGDRGLERIDLGDGLTVLLEQPFVTAAENAGENV